MTEAVDFNSILDTPADEIKAKPPLPVGSYLWRISKMDSVKSAKKGTDGIEFTLACLEAKDDVDQEMLEAAGGIVNRTTRTTFYVTADSANMLKEFLVNKVGLEGSGRTLRQLLAEALNQVVGGIVEHGVTKDGRAFAQVNQFFKAE
jgi:hypothetical protein